MIYDAVHLFAQALHDLDHSQEINTSPLSCDGSETWQHGNSLVNYMKLVSNYWFGIHTKHSEVPIILAYSIVADLSLMATLIHTLYKNIIRKVLGRLTKKHILL